MIGLSALELVALVNKGGEETFQLTLEQEKRLSESEELYNFFVWLLKFRSIKSALRKARLKK